MQELFGLIWLGPRLSQITKKIWTQYTTVISVTVMLRQNLYKIFKIIATTLGPSSLDSPQCPASIGVLNSVIPLTVRKLQIQQYHITFIQASWKEYDKMNYLICRKRYLHSNAFDIYKIQKFSCWFWWCALRWSRISDSMYFQGIKTPTYTIFSGTDTNILLRLLKY